MSESNYRYSRIIYTADGAGGLTTVHREGAPSRLRRDKRKAYAVANGSDSPALIDEFKELLPKLVRSKATFIFFVKRRFLPSFSYREDPAITSFACTGDLLKYFPDSELLSNAALCFKFFSALSSSGCDFNVYAVQFPGAKLSEPTIPSRTVRFVVPHSGPADYVPACVSSLLRNPGITSEAISFAIDGVPTLSLKSYLRSVRLHLYYTGSSGNGPYLLRNFLIAQATEEIAIFQDSDDIACADRASKLASALDSNDVGLVGSHELRLDCFRQLVVPVRYPIDVSAALSIGPTHALLHPTSAVRIALFRQAGCFSTSQRHSMDSQFLLRFYFHAQIRNVDEFLYIRRWRPGTLCTNPTTALGTYDRARLLVSWGRAFLIAKTLGHYRETTLSVPSRSGNGNEPAFVRDKV